MAEITQMAFKHVEIVEMLIKKQQIHEGIWGLFIKFGIAASNVGATEAELNPAAIIPVLEIGLQKFEKETNLSLDAAKVNPKPTAEKKSKK
jgi:hypothetical protein